MGVQRAQSLGDSARSPLPGTLSGGQVIRVVPEKPLFLFAASLRPV